MAERKAPNYLKLKKFKLKSEIEHLLIGVAVHFGIRQHDIVMDKSYMVYSHSLKLFIDNNLQHYLQYKEYSSQQIADAFGCSFKFWEYEKDYRIAPQRPKLIREIHSNYNCNGVIHFGLAVQSIDCLILQPEIYGLNASMTLNFKEAIAEVCKISITDVAEKWPSDEIQFRDEVKLKKLFGVGLELWSKTSKKQADFVDLVPDLVFKSRYKNHVKLMADFWPKSKTKIHIKDQFTISKMTLYCCPQDYCLFASTDRSNFDKHVKTCSDETKVNFQQSNLLDDDICEWLIQQNFLSKRPVNNHNHVHYDTETILSPIGSQNGKTTILGEEKLISIGLSHNLGGKIESSIFAREKMDEDSLIKMVGDFWKELLSLRELHRKNLDPEINKCFFRIQNLLYPTEKDVFDKKIQENLSDPLKCKLHQAHRYLDQLRSLKCLGFNSEHFDMKLLFPELLKVFDNDPSKESIILNIIKRGTSIMYLKFESIELKDCKSFYPNGTLNSFGQQFGVDVHKECFPYELWTDLDAMKAAQSWPNYSDFKSSLRPFVISNPEEKIRNAISILINEMSFKTSKAVELFDLSKCCSDIRILDEKSVPDFTINDLSSFTLDPEVYIRSMATFNHLKEIGEIKNMHDYLLVYNKLDCIVGLKAFTKMNELFDEQFGISLLNNYSIPAASLKILWKYYDRRLNSAYSFGNKFPEIPENIRKYGYKGGLATPLNQRHAEANGDCNKYPDFVTKAPNGEPFKEITVKDITSLYG